MASPTVPLGVLMECIMIKKAFTLIELLVVIAIIAILAAILFPVFAQAKLAAKATSALSDSKQTALAEIMYAGDSDDFFVPASVWNTGSDPLCFGGPPGCFSTWTWLVQPYTKNGDILNNPLSQSQYSPPLLGSNVIQDTYTPTFGYNYDALAPWYPSPGVAGNCATIHAVGGSAPQTPANLPMISAKFNDHDYPAGANGGSEAWGFFGYGELNGQCGTFGTPILNTTIDAPDCGTINSYCVGNWGIGGQWSTLIPTAGVQDGIITGGNSLLATGSMIVSFADGHAKKVQPGYMATGTNWSTVLNQANLVVNNTSTYMWWVNPATGN